MDKSGQVRNDRRVGGVNHLLVVPLLQPKGVIPEIDAFSEYLAERRREETGAVGMRKNVGSAWACTVIIIGLSLSISVSCMTVTVA